MSKETHQWLAENVLVGYTEKRGRAWHYQDGDTNHYPMAIPVADVEKRLFHWEAEELPLYAGSNPTALPEHKAIGRSDTGLIMGVFKQGYQPHQPAEWLVGNVATILDTNTGDLGIGSAGLLRGGRQAFVSVEVPDTITTPEGVAFRPNLLAVTSFDGTLATTYKGVVTNVVCDNTMAAGLREGGGAFKVKHSRHSMGKAQEARDALGMVFAIAADFAEEVKGLCEQEVTDAEFERLIKAEFAPAPKGKDGKAPSKRAVTMADNKRADLLTLWRHDERVAPWRGTGYGVVQALNTWHHHVQSHKGDNRAERNMIRMVSGDTEKEDREVMGVLAGV